MQSESCFVNLRRNNENIVLGVVYRPPSGNYREFINVTEEFIDQCANPYLEEFILCGDFNINLLNYENNRVSQSFLTSIQSYTLLPTITKPTRIADYTATLIDNIFTMSSIDFGILSSDMSDHFPIFLIRRKLFLNHTHTHTLY